jgi:hypothetical protein
MAGEWHGRGVQCESAFTEQTGVDDRKGVEAVQDEDSMDKTPLV